ncbi:hypothetical protein niasHT_029540 [Heterodera trifolii]|uniref:Transmembrane protein n=1 Tax=Heterodera trifolii TaxID=157864 RepID=A0ABD2JAZ7_9BILA
MFRKASVGAGRVGSLSQVTAAIAPRLFNCLHSPASADASSSLIKEMRLFTLFIITCVAICFCLPPSARPKDEQQKKADIQSDKNQKEWDSAERDNEEEREEPKMEGKEDKTAKTAEDKTAKTAKDKTAKTAEDKTAKTAEDKGKGGVNGLLLGLYIALGAIGIGLITWTLCICWRRCFRRSGGGGGDELIITESSSSGSSSSGSSSSGSSSSGSSSSGAEQNADNEGKSGDWTCWTPWKWMPPPGAFSYTQGGVGGVKPK